MIRKNKKFSDYFFSNVGKVSQLIDQATLNTLVKHLVKVKKDKGRVFFLGVGGSAGNCSHAVNDFRKLCNLESYTPIDNVSELTARINDEGWDTVFAPWLACSHLSNKDAVFVFSISNFSRFSDNHVSLLCVIWSNSCPKLFRVDGDSRLFKRNAVRIEVNISGLYISNTTVRFDFEFFS